MVGLHDGDDDYHHAWHCIAILLALVGIHALIHHHDADTSQVFASPASAPTHLNVLPTLHPPVPPHSHSHHIRGAAQL